MSSVAGVLTRRCFHGAERQAVSVSVGVNGAQAVASCVDLPRRA
jgi:hypothetical protein